MATTIKALFSMKKLLFPLSAFIAIATAATAQIPLDYYVKLDGLSGRELKQAIFELVNDDVKMLTYGSGTNKTWWGFYVTDRTPDGFIRDRYSAGEFTFGERGASNSSMNIEHSFPKSWWGSAENNAYKDLYNLMPCESTINNWKSNYPMGPVDQVWRTNDITKVGARNGDPAGTTYRFWEPADNWKGDFARGYMYMATAYQNFTWSGDQSPRILNTEAYPTLQPWAYELYLQWAVQDPVDEIETARNVEVEALQGNRNPYVDFPNLAQYVWGDSVNIPFRPLTTVKSAPAVGGARLRDLGKEKRVLYTNSMLGDEGGCSISHVEGSVSAWTNTEGYGWKASGSRGTTANLTCYKVKEVLYLPEISLTNCASATLTFDHAVNFLDMPREDLSVVVEVTSEQPASAQQYAAPSQEQTTLYVPRWPLGTSWSFFNSKEVSLDEYRGKRIRVGFCYTSSTDRAATWEVKNVKITATEGSAGIDNILPDFMEQEMLDPEDRMPVEYCTLDGRLIPSTEILPSNTILICRRGSHVWKLRIP